MPRALTARSIWFPVLLAAALAAALTFLTLPVVAIFVDSSPGELLDSLDEPGALDALWLSLRTTATAMAMILRGRHPGRVSARHARFRGRAVLVTLIELPLVLPPAVAGIALLAAVGPEGILGGTARRGRDRALAPHRGRGRGAHVRGLAVLRAPGEGRVRRAGPDAARRIAHARRLRGARVRAGDDPAAMPGLRAGAALAMGRALGEFGATLMFAGSFQGVTQTVPLAIYDRFATDFTARSRSRRCWWPWPPRCCWRQARGGLGGARRAPR